MQGQGVCYISARLVRTIGLQLFMLIRYEQTETYFAVKEVLHQLMIPLQSFAFFQS